MVQLTDEEIELLKTALGNWKRIGVPATIGEWLVHTSLGETVKMANVWLWEE